MQKILIVTCKKLGAGHYSAALAIEKYLAKKEHIKVYFYDWEFIAGPLYEFLLKKFPKVWKHAYNLFDTEAYAEFSKGFENNLFQKKVGKYLNAFDKIILTVPSAHYIGYNDKLAHKTYVLITDYGKIPIAWTLYTPHTFFVTDPYTRSLLERSNRYADAQIHVSGIPVSRTTKDLALQSKHAIRQELGIVTTRFYTIVGGGVGDKGLIKVFKKLINLPQEQVENTGFMVVCGRNKKLYEAFNRLINTRGLQTVKITGFIDNNLLLKYFRASDMVITKPGGITLTELINLQTPIAVPFAHPQEYGNRNFVIKHKIGVVNENIDDFFDLVLGQSSDELKAYERNMREIAQYNSAEVIAETVISG
ncbi:MAG: glycosyltransferase [Candidatus Dojkabacteria bacterium]